MTTGPDDAERSATRIVLRPIGTPLSMGFLGLVGAAFATAGLQLGWVPRTESVPVGLAVMTFTVPLQLIASGYGFLARDGVAGTGMGVLAGGWLAVGAGLFTAAPGHPSSGIGLLALAVGCCLLVPTTVGLRAKALAAVVMGLAALRFVLIGAYLLAGGGWRLASGVEGLVLAAVGLYAALAFELEDELHHTRLPTLRRHQGATAIAGTYPEEVAGVHEEAGVRREL